MRVLISDEIIKAAEKNPPPAAPMPAGSPAPGPNGRPAPVSLRDPGPAPQQQMLQRGPSAQASMPPPQNRPPQGYSAPRAQGPPPQGYMPGPGQPRQGVPVASSAASANRSPMPQQAQQAARRF